MISMLRRSACPNSASLTVRGACWPLSRKPCSNCGERPGNAVVWGTDVIPFGISDSVPVAARGLGGGAGGKTRWIECCEP